MLSKVAKILILLTICYGCTPKSKPVRLSNDLSVDTSDIQKVVTKTPEFSTLFLKNSEFQYTNEGLLNSFKSTFNMDLDSFINIQLTTTFNISALTFNATLDSIFFEEARVRKPYTYSYNDIDSIIGFPIDLSTIANLLTGQNNPFNFYKLKEESMQIESNYLWVNQNYENGLKATLKYILPFKKIVQVELFKGKKRVLHSYYIITESNDYKVPKRVKILFYPNNKPCELDFSLKGVSLNVAK